MTRGELKLLTIYGCDYRVVEEVPTCGCAQHLTRCLLAKGENCRDPYDVLTGDCVRCMTIRSIPWATYS